MIDGAAGVTVEVSPGELVDRLTIQRLRVARLPAGGPARGPAERQLAALEAARRALPPAAGLDDRVAELAAVNAALWDAEDGIRACDRAGDFGPRFVDLARSVYRLNDRRAALKTIISRLFDAAVVEEKVYAG